MIICCIGAETYIELHWNIEKEKKTTPNIPGHLSIWIVIENTRLPRQNTLFDPSWWEIKIASLLWVMCMIVITNFTITVYFLLTEWMTGLDWSECHGWLTAAGFILCNHSVFIILSFMHHGVSESSKVSPSNLWKVHRNSWPLIVTTLKIWVIYTYLVSLSQYKNNVIPNLVIFYGWNYLSHLFNVTTSVKGLIVWPISFMQK